MADLNSVGLNAIQHLEHPWRIRTCSFCRGSSLYSTGWEAGFHKVVPDLVRESSQPPRITSQSDLSSLLIVMWAIISWGDRKLCLPQPDAYAIPVPENPAPPSSPGLFLVTHQGLAPVFTPLWAFSDPRTLSLPGQVGASPVSLSFRNHCPYHTNSFIELPLH